MNSRIRFHAAALLGLALLAGGPAAPAGAQDSDPRDRLAQEIERTGEIIERARAAVERSESERAASILGLAVEIQTLAEAEFAHCDRDHLRACEGAARATTRARREAFHAIQVARGQSDLAERAERAIERAGRLLDEARAANGDPADRRGDRLLDEAGAQLARARERYEERQFAVALRLAEAAMRLLRESLDLGEISDLDRERVARELERTDRLIERAVPIVRESGNERAEHDLARARDLEVRAHREFDRDRLLVAFRLTREARERVFEALGLAAGPLDEAQVTRAIHQTQELIERVEPVVRGSGIDKAVELLENGLGHQRRARELLGGRRLAAALAETRVARNLVLEASAAAGGEGRGSR